MAFIFRRQQYTRLERKSAQSVRNRAGNKETYGGNKMTEAEKCIINLQALLQQQGRIITDMQLSVNKMKEITEAK